MLAGPSDPRPAPYPADTRAKGWRFELDHERIRQSDTWALASPEVRPWLLMLWMVAWEQAPCGSLPADDELIAARIGMPAKAFAKHRAVLLRGWFMADDGRLYHETITARVQAMLDKRAKDAKRTADRRERTTVQRASSDGVAGVSRVTTTGHTSGSTVSSTPSTKHQAPEEIQASAIVRAGERPPPAPTEAGAVGLAFKAAGVDPTTLNLSDPRLLALLRQGAEPAEFEGLAREAIRKGIDHPFSWCLATLPERRKAAAAIALQPRQGGGKHSGFAAKNYREGVSADGSLD